MDLVQELKNWLDEQFITSQNIGEVRRRLFVPWSSEWNGIVRDETAARENIYPKGLGNTIETVKDFYGGK